MKRYFINNGEMDVHITEWCDSKNPVILCLHGLGSTSLSFIEIGEELKDEFRIISVDAPGHGKTSPFEEGYRYEMPQLVSWLNNIVDILQIPDFYFLSHSWGSFVALYFLESHSDRVKGSLLIDGGYQTKKLMDESLEEEIAYYEKDFEEYVFDSWQQFFKTEKEAYSRWSPLLQIAVKDLAFEQNHKIHWHCRGTTAKHIIKAMHKHETLDIYEQMPKNILLLRATLPKSHDSYRDKTANIFKEKTLATVRLIENTNHFIHWDNPHVVIQEIRDNWK